MNVASPSCKCNPTMLRGGDDGAEASETARRIFEVWRGEALHLGPDPLPGVPSMADLAVLSACHTTPSVWDSLHHNRMHPSISPSISFDFPALYLGYLRRDQYFLPSISVVHKTRRRETIGISYFLDVHPDAALFIARSRDLSSRQLHRISFTPPLHPPSDWRGIRKGIEGS
jgi:hypothetical protein